ncbi:hypothetical protein Smp_161750 [Schistosoma mansoni]|uniref:hypothetical protein n=1 Tax=Schistosoma mansoni TaxID=6183 RepID=UPI0001A620CD|nr:hypothetical protein Smp_161750 [Schistosoma mansoni]|eukprot:XP_018648278.1 hypothetical protein Smp_161750 [Schistosoma mansoni]
MTSSLYDDLDILDGTPLDNLTSSESSNKSGNAPLVGLRVTANWSESDVSSNQFNMNPSSVNSNSSEKSLIIKLLVSIHSHKKVSMSSSLTNIFLLNLSSVVHVMYTFKRIQFLQLFNQLTGRLERCVSGSSGGKSKRSLKYSNTAMTNGLLFGEPNLPLGVMDEYNPMIPNEYEELARIKRERRRAEESALADRHHRLDPFGMNDPSGMCRRYEYSDEEDDEDNEYTAASGRNSSQPTKGAAIAPPSVLLEDVTVTSGSNASQNSESSVNDDDPGVSTASSKFGINVVAAKMMARMGYREGQGLGRESQGMSTALVVEKTSRRGGKIIHEKDQQRQQIHANASATTNNSLPSYLSANVEETFNNLPLPENRSCVILLRNMCGPGEVDDDLEPETAEECAKYGKVVMCMIYELPEAPDDEVVRIFVEFESEEAATKAVLDLNGRFFAGRVVKAGFYDAEKFRNLELADAPLST